MKRSVCVSSSAKNSLLKKLLAEAELDKAMLKAIAKGNF